MPCATDGVDPGAGDHSCLIEIGGGGKEHDAGFAQRRDLLCGGNAEMKTDDLWPLGHQHGEHRVVFDETLVDLEQLTRNNSTVSREDRRESGQPRTLPITVADGWPMTEDIDVERTVRIRSHIMDHFPCCFGVRRTDADRPQSPRV